jgi:hypothetical protein
VSEQREGLRLLTLTRLWLFGRFMYTLGEYKLWTPIPHRAIGYALAVLVPANVVLSLLRVPFSGPGLTWRVVVPVVFVWWLLRVVAEGARPSEVLGSWARLVWFVVRTPAVGPVRIRERSGRRG